MPNVPMSLSGIRYKPAFVLTHLNPLVFHSALAFQTAAQRSLRKSSDVACDREERSAGAE